MFRSQNYDAFMLSARLRATATAEELKAWAGK